MILWKYKQVYTQAHVCTHTHRPFHINFILNHLKRSLLWILYSLFYKEVNQFQKNTDFSLVECSLTIQCLSIKSCPVEIRDRISWHILQWLLYSVSFCHSIIHLLWRISDNSRMFPLVVSHKNGTTTENLNVNHKYFTLVYNFIIWNSQIIMISFLCFSFSCFGLLFSPSLYFSVYECGYLSNFVCIH